MSVNVQEQISEALQLHQAGLLTEAAESYCKILKSSPENVDALNLLGLLKLQIREYEDAVFYINKASEIQPCAYFSESLGRAYFESGDFTGAINSYKKSLEYKSDDFEVWFNLALAYKSDNQLEKSLEAYQSALSINPNSPDVHFNMGNVLENLNDTFQALEYYQKADELNINSKYINYFLAVSYLKTKNFKDGWKYYEDRPSRAPGILTQLHRYNELLESKPVWNGEDIKDKTLFLYYEAGLGDTIMYARYIPLLKDKCAKILFKPQSGLVTFLDGCDFGVEMVDCQTPIESVVADTHIPIMSLPYVLQLNSEKDIPASDKFLKSDPEKVKIFKDKYFNNDKLKIGIKWQGNPAYDTCRIIPLEAFHKLLDLPNTKFYSLQKDDGAEEIEKLPSKFELIDLGPEFNDFADTAAAVENLDLVICNDTSVAHLVGGLGKPCWVMLPYVCNWRWHTDISYSPWYDSVKLFKQIEPDNWDEVFDRLHDELTKILDTSFSKV